MLQEKNDDSPDKPNPSKWRVLRPLVLIVEPDKQIQRIARRTVEELGYGAVVANDGENGFALAKYYVPDLVLTAALMPKLDGREMCLMIKNNLSTSRVTVAVMTAIYTQQKHRSEAFRRFKVDEYLCKPVNMMELQSILRKYLSTEVTTSVNDQTPGS